MNDDETLPPVEYPPDIQALVDGKKRYRGKDKKKFWGVKKNNPVRGHIKQHYLHHQLYRCCYCRRQFFIKSGAAWHVDHIIALSIRHEFMHEPQNMAAACIRCNVIKREKPVTVEPANAEFPRTSTAYLLTHPHFDNWWDHLTRTDLVYTWKTDKGKFTIGLCKLDEIGRDFIGYRAKTRGKIDYEKLKQEFQDAKTDNEIDTVWSKISKILEGNGHYDVA